MVLIESFQVQLGSNPPSFSLQGTDEQIHTLENFSDAKVLVVVFMCNHCPYVKACIERLVALQRDFLQNGVQFVGINSNDATDYPEDGFEAMKNFVTEHVMNFPYLLDETQEVARAYHAVCTPDIFVYDRDRKLQYHGRIDNNWKDISKVTTHDLQNALESVLNHKALPELQYPSMGCSIKWQSK